MTTDRREIIGRVQKILARTKSRNEHEAAVAAAMAQKFLAEHNLTLAEVEGIKATSKLVQRTDLNLDLKKNEGRWKELLASYVAEFNGCGLVLLTGWAGKKTQSAAFVGPPEDVEVVKAIYTWVVQQLEGLVGPAYQAYCTNLPFYIEPDPRPRWRRSFFLGAAQTVGVRLRDAWLALQKQSEVTTAIVLHRKEAIDAFKQQEWPNLGKSRAATGPGSLAGYLTGRNAGQRVGIGKGEKLPGGREELDK